MTTPEMPRELEKKRDELADKKSDWVCDNSLEPLSGHDLVNIEFACKDMWDACYEELAKELEDWKLGSAVEAREADRERENVKAWRAQCEKLADLLKNHTHSDDYGYPWKENIKAIADYQAFKEGMK